MTSRLPKSSRVALSLTVAVTAMALGGSAYAQDAGGDVNVSSPSTGGSLRNTPASDFTDQAATEEETAEPATDEAPPADEPQAEADEGTNTIRRSRATYDGDPAEPE